MQATRNRAGLERQEFFTSKTPANLTAAMDSRLMELIEKGEVLIGRITLTKNMKCPCGSGRKFKRCCIEKTQLV